MTDGFLLIDKPTGPTSHDIVRQARRRLKTKRIGHAGTLDPFASGLLMLLINRSARLFNYLTGLEKVYEGVIRLGERTDTDDRTGVLVQTSEEWKRLDASTVGRVMHDMVGRQLQVPPTYSAKKLQGVPAHRRVRRGEEVELTPHEVTIWSFEPLTLDGPLVRFRASVSTGTYIRALARDVGERLGCGGHLTELRRVAIGPFEVANAIEVDQIAWETVAPPRDLVGHLPNVLVDSSGKSDICHGRSIPGGGARGGATVAVLSDSELVAIGQVTEEGLIRPKCVFGPDA